MLAIPERRSNRINLNIKVNEVFEPLFQPARYKGAYGGRGSGKSWCFAEMLVQRCIVEPGTALKLSAECVNFIPSWQWNQLCSTRRSGKH